MSSISAISSSSGFWQSIGQGLQSGAKVIEEEASEVGDAVVSALSSVEESVESGVSAVGDAISSGITAVKEEWETLGNSIDTYS